jgi:osmotically-inducible protein OsmY
VSNIEASDEIIKKNIIDHLFWDSRLDASKINVYVEHGNVKLTGKIPNYEAKSIAFRDTLAIKGVKKIENLLEVEFPEKPTDESIKINAEEALRYNLNVDPSDIKISVRAGIVKIEGTVTTYWEKFKAESIVAGVYGVIDINNELAVVPSEDYKDKKIAEDIISALERNNEVKAKNINVRVKDGKVTISGNVPNWWAYRSALDAVEFTKGVVDIENQLIIKD